MTIYCGVDFHARTQTLSYCDTQNGEIHSAVLDHSNKDEVRAFYSQSPGDLIVGLEASGYSPWFEHLIAELGHTLWLGDAAEIRRLAKRRQKNDRRDADLILELLMNLSQLKAPASYHHYPFCLTPIIRPSYILIGSSFIALVKIFKYAPTIYSMGRD